MSAGWSDVLTRLINSGEKKPLSRALVVKYVVEPNKKVKRKIPSFQTKRQKPSIQDGYEKMLQSISTKGVVQLFNSISELEEVEPPPAKQAKKSEPGPSSSIIDKWGDLTMEDEEAS